jgi:hypothetical protein
MRFLKGMVMDHNTLWPINVQLLIYDVCKHSTAAGRSEPRIEGYEPNFAVMLGSWWT